jgi:hypothetical protein
VLRPHVQDHVLIFARALRPPELPGWGMPGVVSVISGTPPPDSPCAADALPVVGHHDAAQVGMPFKANAEKIEDLALVKIGRGPDRCDRLDRRASPSASPAAGCAPYIECERMCSSTESAARKGTSPPRSCPRRSCSRPPAPWPAPARISRGDGQRQLAPVKLRVHQSLGLPGQDGLHRRMLRKPLQHGRLADQVSLPLAAI